MKNNYGISNYMGSGDFVMVYADSELCIHETGVVIDKLAKSFADIKIGNRLDILGTITKFREVGISSITIH